jgi:hypothetical protein
MQRMKGFIDRPVGSAKSTWNVNSKWVFSEIYSPNTSCNCTSSNYECDISCCKRLCSPGLYFAKVSKLIWYIWGFFVALFRAYLIRYSALKFSLNRGLHLFCSQSRITCAACSVDIFFLCSRYGARIRLSAFL